jgi:fimbrial isopeptide formation D2 family protein/LPXTG-motif cell wall-anchored protein
MKVITKNSFLKKTGIFAILIAMVLTLIVPMASFADSAVPAGTMGSITIHKVMGTGHTDPWTGTGSDATNAGNNGTAPAPNGITFSYWKVTEQATASGADFIINGRYYVAVTNPGGSGGYNHGPAADGSGTTTGGTGVVKFESLPLGLYLVQETHSDSNVSPVSPFVVSIPTTVVAGGDVITDVDVYPKGYDLGIEKEAVAPGTGTGTDSLPAAIGDTIDWDITTHIPADYDHTSNKNAFKITDSPSSGLQFVAGSVVIHGTTWDANNAGAALPSSHYTVTGGSTDGENVYITFTSLGLSELRAGDTVKVVLKTKITDNANIGTGTDNEAQLDYTNSLGEDFTAETDTDSPEIVTGGLSLYKVNGITDEGLLNAEFKLVKRSASGGYEADLTAAKADTHADGNGFYMNATTTTAFTATSAGSGTTLGYFEFKGLPYGDYWLVETAVPDGGYRLIGEPVEVTINASSYNDALLLADAVSGHKTIANYKGFEFPLTGGMGTLIFVVGGIVLIGLAGIVIVSTRRKKKEITE